ncbi:MAG: UDP-N-acetylglucosamine 2-epimerase (non-hydrolyzing) [Candidatus Methanofastidiosa archaeon]|nr:UDP-N-acetylglucosamine 2-epimerase (non-hydrolyzing) [Candidatus Methanofastidiosa archaeon]
MVRIATVIGARPQFIKAAPVSRALAGVADEILIHTGQHYDPGMSDVFFEEMHIPVPTYNLGIGSWTQGHQTGEMLKGIESILLSDKPDIVLVYGDTNSTLAGALAAAKLHLPVAHVEAGLRSFDKSMPEEINRILTDHVSTHLFCPTKTAAANLASETIMQGVHVTGDVMADALAMHAPVAARSSEKLARLGLVPGAYTLCTVHRQSNTDDQKHLAAIVSALGDVGDVVMPLHPRTRRALVQAGLYEQAAQAMTLIEPVGYLDMLALEQNARLILTDSGGVQKEAYLLGVPCVTLRENTEWTETVDDGWNVLVGADRDAICSAAASFRPKGPRSDVFGDGKASERIASILADKV